MNEQLAVEDRARRHAALGDALRLTIVDTLRWGDASPTALQAQLKVPSNLLAHHLHILEQAGLVTRHRSEADKRRSYVSLAHHAAASVDGAFVDVAPHLVAPRVVFVCTGNSARSQFAAALWAHASDVPVASAGTHPADAVAKGAIAVAARHGLALANNVPRHMADVVTQGDLVITVCDSAHEDLHLDGALHWSVSDPVRTGSDDAFERAFADVVARIDFLSPLIHSS